VGIAFLAIPRISAGARGTAWRRSQDRAARLRFDTGRARIERCRQIDVDANNQIMQQEFLFNTAMSGETGADEGGGATVRSRSFYSTCCCSCAASSSFDGAITNCRAPK